MTENKQISYRFLAIGFLVIGIMFGVTYRPTGVCLGDYILSAFGIPLWSGGTSGIHYSGMFGFILSQIGLVIFSATLQKKIRRMFWIITFLLLCAINFGLTYI